MGNETKTGALEYKEGCNCPSCAKETERIKKEAEDLKKKAEVELAKIQAETEKLKQEEALRKKNEDVAARLVDEMKKAERAKIVAAKYKPSVTAYGSNVCESASVLGAQSVTSNRSISMKKKLSIAAGTLAVMFVSALTLPPYIKIPVVNFQSPDALKTDSILKKFRVNVASEDAGEFQIDKKSGEIQFVYAENQELLKGVDAGIQIGRNVDGFEFDLKEKKVVAKVAPKAKAEEQVAKTDALPADVKISLAKYIQIKTNGNYYVNSSNEICYDSYGPFNAKVGRISRNKANQIEVFDKGSLNELAGIKDAFGDIEFLLADANE